MKTLLYKDCSTEKILTFNEVKAAYMEANNSDLPIPDDDMQLIILENSVNIGGNISVVKDAVLDWCNEYAEFNEADRYLSQSERDTSVRDIYECLINKEETLFEEVINILIRDSKDHIAGAAELSKKLATILWKNLDDTPIDDKDCILENWHSFIKGTSRYDIWSWFEETFSLSVAMDLMHLEEGF